MFVVFIVLKASINKKWNVKNVDKKYINGRHYMEVDLFENLFLPYLFLLLVILSFLLVVN